MSRLGWRGVWRDMFERGHSTKSCIMSNLLCSRAKGNGHHHFSIPGYYLHARQHQADSSFNVQQINPMADRRP